MLVLLTSAGLYGVFAGIFICHPVRKFWDASADGHCFRANVLWLIGAGMNIPLDCAVWIIPMPVLAKLRLPRKQMTGVCIVFALGGLCVFRMTVVEGRTNVNDSICVTSIARLVVVHTVAIKGEHTKAGVRSVQWSAIEANVGIICASLMALKPLILRFAPKLLVDSQPSRHAMRISPIDDEDMGEAQFWTGGSLTTTCAGSEGTGVGSSRPTDKIKVTTHMEQTTSRRSSGALVRMSELWAYRHGAAI